VTTAWPLLLLRTWSGSSLVPIPYLAARWKDGRRGVGDEPRADPFNIFPLCYIQLTLLPYELAKADKQPAMEIYTVDSRYKDI
jgi:hypothetical protein